MQETVRSRGWLKPPAFVLLVCAFALILMKAADGLVIVWGAALNAIEACYDASWGYGLKHLASVYILLATMVVCWFVVLSCVRFAIRFVSRVLLRSPLPLVDASPSEGKRAMGHQETDRGARSKGRRAAFWLGVVAAAPALIWCCDRGINELHRRSVIDCFHAADKISVEYTERDRSKDEFDVTCIPRRHEIANKEQLAAIAQHLSGIRLDEFQSNYFFILPGGMVSNWGAPFKVSVYNSQDAAPRQFAINSEALYEIGRRGRVFLHCSEELLRDLCGGSAYVVHAHQQSRHW